jgi:steroid delta-isomerase-like uncharacterized protein
MSFSHKALVCSLLDEVVNNGQFDRLAALVAPDVVAEVPSRGEQLSGIEQLADVLAELRAAFPDLGVVIEGGRILHEHDPHIVGKGLSTDRVAVHLVFRGTQRDVYLGLPPSGRVEVWSEAWFVRIADDRIVELTVIGDRLNRHRELGETAFGSAPDARSAEPV